MIFVMFLLNGAQTISASKRSTSIGESKQSRPATFTQMARFCHRRRWSPRHEPNFTAAPATIMFAGSEKSNRHLSPNINQHGQWLASKTASTKRSIAIISIDKFVQIRIKNCFFCDLPIYPKPLDNVVCIAGRRYILLLSTNYSSQVSEK